MMECLLHGFFILFILGSAPVIWGIVIEVQTSVCDPPRFRNASSALQTISIKPAIKSCQWTIYIDNNQCLAIYFPSGADRMGEVEIVDKNESEIRPFVNNTVCSDQVSINYQSNQGNPQEPGTELEIYYQAVSAQGSTISNDLRIYSTTAKNSIHGLNDVRNTSAESNSKESGGSNPGVIAVSVAIPLIVIGIIACIIYVWYRRKYPVRMIVGKDFAKFSNPAYNKRSSTATLVRERAALDDDYQRDIEQGAAYTGVAHDNPALNMEDEPQYQPIPELGHSMTAYANYRRSFEDSPKLEKKAPEKPKRVYSVEPQQDDDQETEHREVNGRLQHEESADYENVSSNVRIDSVEKTKQSQGDETPENKATSENTPPAYEDVITAEEEHAYDTTRQHSGKTVDLESSLDDSALYENLTFNRDNQTKDEGSINVKSREEVPDSTSNGTDIEEIVNDSSKTEEWTDLDDHPTSLHDESSSLDINKTTNVEESSSSGISETLPHPVQEDHKTEQTASDHDHSFPGSFSSDSFVILETPEPHPNGNKIDDTTEKSQHVTLQDNLDDQKRNLFDKPEEQGLEFDNGHAHDEEKTEQIEEADADRSFDLDVDNLNISVSSISDPDVKSVDSTFSIVSRGLKSVDESSDSFEVISRDHDQISQGDIKDVDDGPTTNVVSNDKQEKESMIGQVPENEQPPPLPKTIQPDMKISALNSSESETSDNEEMMTAEETENLREMSNDRRESVTRKITLDRGSISFDDSTSGSSSHSEGSDVEDFEKPKPTLARRESITLDNPVFDSPDVNISLKFTPEKNSDKPEQPRGLTRRKSITLDNPLFEKDSEIAPDPEVSPLDSYQVIESEPLDEPISEESEGEGEGMPDIQLPVPQRKVLKISMDIGEDDDGSTSSAEDVNSDPDSSTEA